MEKSWQQVAVALVAIVTSAFSAVPALAQTQTPTPTPTPVSADYIIGPGDQLQVYVWRNPELTTTVPVRPDGKISTPLVEDMVAIGKSPSQLARDMEKVLAEFVRDPRVNVIVDKAASTFSQIKVMGEVLTPQAIPYREGLKVLDVVLACGGLKEFAAPNRSRILRDENGEQKEIKVKLGKLMDGGDLTQNYELRPGDVLIVPQSRF
ncbi:MAG TPA: XrtA/PEP-CTERM system exopolysaccharide export protein [Povalibacter sp.]